ncbi:MAG: phosphoribosyl-AMP cyclohydrolase [Rickettsiales bacterium]|jgi:phosphoribosyl-AMP cyclohydrolase
MLRNLQFNDQGLIPVITQQFDNKEVLMLAWMNKEAIKLTLEKKLVHYWSRSRKKMWLKGETSGNFQKLIEFRYDCDQDAILILVDQKNGACHTGEYSCFFNKVK